MKHPKLLAALLTVLGAVAFAAPAPLADAKPLPRARKVTQKPLIVPRHDGHDGAHARVAINHLGDLRPGREIVGRREEPLTAEEDTARQIEKLLRGPLRYGVTGLFVADARTGEALFAVNGDDPLNPASNVKMISTATALELLGADFRYPTRVLGATPDHGVVHGDVYLLGSYDPTLTAGDYDDLAAKVAASGITQIDGTVTVGSDPTRDGLFRTLIPINIRGSEPGAPPIAAAPSGMDLVAVKMTAKTVASGRARLGYQLASTTDAAGRPRILLTVSGTIGKGVQTSYPLTTHERTAAAAYLLRAALRAHGVTVNGDYKIAELPDYVAAETLAGNLPVELGRHQSARLADIIAHVNKWSINWLADRVIMTAAALTKQQPPSMDLALAAMYDWLGRHPHIAKDALVVDTGSGLSYRTRITPHELVSIVRSAGGFTGDGDAGLATAWRDSLSIAGTDGTLTSRFHTADMRGHIHAKTGTLSTVVALSGIVDIDPDRPLAFSLVTNGDVPLSPRYIRHAHEQLLSLLCRYVAATRKAPMAPALPATPAAPTTMPPAAQPGQPAPDDADRAELDELEPDSALDDEAAGKPQ